MEWVTSKNNGWQAVENMYTCTKRALEHQMFIFWFYICNSSIVTSYIRPAPSSGSPCIIYFFISVYFVWCLLVCFIFQCQVVDYSVDVLKSGKKPTKVQQEHLPDVSCVLGLATVQVYFTTVRWVRTQLPVCVISFPFAKHSIHGSWDMKKKSFLKIHARKGAVHTILYFQKWSGNLDITY